MVRGFSDAGFHTVLQVTTGFLTMLDRARGLAIGWVRDAEDLPMPERAAPLRRLLQAWMVDRGMVLAHAGAVGLPDGGVLLAGGEGAGKSNTALACLRSSLLFAGDDYCLVDVASPPRIHSLYSTAKTHADDLVRLPFLAPMVSNHGRLAHEKALYFLQRHVPETLTASFPLRAVVAVRVSGGGDTVLAPTPRGPILRALAPSTVLLAPLSGAPTLGALGRLVRRVPAYELRVGTNPDQVPATILGLLGRLRDTPAAL